LRACEFFSARFRAYIDNFSVDDEASRNSLGGVNNLWKPYGVEDSVAVLKCNFAFLLYDYASCSVVFAGYAYA
jgi:hypothetical protein